MLESQNNKCAICEEDFFIASKRGIFIDHCHTTGITRKLLCLRCNTILGMSKDNVNILNNAIKYLKEYM